MVLQVVTTDWCSSLLFLLTDFPLVLLFISALVTMGSMKPYLQPIQTAQAVQLLQDSTGHLQGFWTGHVLYKEEPVQPAGPTQ